jgi:hypothetical protein
MIKITIQQADDGNWIADFMFGGRQVEQSWIANTFEELLLAIPEVLAFAKRNGHIQSQNQLSGKS